MARVMYEVVVGNVGTVYRGADEKVANVAFDTYVDLSKSGHGRAAGEEVSFFEDGDLVKEFETTLPHEHT